MKICSVCLSDSSYCCSFLTTILSTALCKWWQQFSRTCLTSWLSWSLLRVKSLKEQLLLVLWCSFCCVQKEFLLKSTWSPFSSELWLQVDFCLAFRLQFQREKGFSFFHVCCFARVRPTYSSREWTFLPRHPITYFRVQAASGFIHSVMKILILKCTSWKTDTVVRLLTNRPSRSYCSFK